jgi:hypothetical protein
MWHFQSPYFWLVVAIVITPPGAKIPNYATAHLSSLTNTDGSFVAAVPRDSVSLHCYNYMVLHTSMVSASLSLNKHQQLNLE